MMDMKVDVVPIETVGRVLDTPTVLFKNGPEKVRHERASAYASPCDFGRSVKFYHAVPLKKWKILQFDYKDGQVHPQVDEFVRVFQFKAKMAGMHVAAPLSVSYISLEGKETPYELLMKNLPSVKTALQETVDDKGLIICILPTRDLLYNDLKSVCNSLGVLTQCIILGTITRKDFKTKQFKKLDMLVENVLRKINAKLGGTNTSLNPSVDGLSSFPPYSMICGMDVYHPGVGENNSASIAGVLASYTSDFTKYFSSVIAQPRETATFKRKEEVEKGLDIVMKDFFMRYKFRNGDYPAFLFFYRDGVSDGQLEKVKNVEVSQILSAMESLRFRAKIAFITVQKRHPIRLFDFRKVGGRYTVYNPPPGTVVDRDIVNPDWNEYYLNSHFAVKGTAKPSQYKLVINEIPPLTSDKIQAISYYLSYIYQRCFKPISIAAPARYAHLVAEKGAQLLEASVRNGKMGNKTVHEVIQAHPNFSGKLFFQ
jgi:eukaryotic translation initiation factor 2C